MRRMLDVTVTDPYDFPYWEGLIAQIKKDLLQQQVDKEAAQQANMEER